MFCLIKVGLRFILGLCSKPTWCFIFDLTIKMGFLQKRVLSVYFGRKGIFRPANKLPRNKYSSFGTLIKTLLVKVVSLKLNCLFYYGMVTSTHGVSRCIYVTFYYLRKCLVLQVYIRNLVYIICSFEKF